MSELMLLWFSNKWLCWGLGGYLAANIGYYLPVLVLEWVIRQPFAQKYRVVYSEKANREKLAAVTQSKVADFWTQLKTGAGIISGPVAILNATLSALLMPLIVGGDDWTLIPSTRKMITMFILLQLVGDLGLYLGHRVQHESQWLWDNFHSFHHKLDTPTPVGTLYIDQMDATLQGGLPMVLAAIVTQPHPLVFTFYIFTRIAENVVNHSGLDHWFVNLITLKCIPGRASIAHHDGHHKYSNYKGKAKNYGENFWIWDWVFGTMRKSTTKKLY